jgi:hypothetical protein
MESLSFYEYFDKEKLDNVKGGMFKNNSYGGHSSQVLKSGICKYYRRKMFDKFEYCLIDMMLFGPSKKALLTNLFNRIRILLMEEIVFTEVGPITQCIRLLDNIESLDFSSQIQNMLKISKIVQTCKRARVVSYIRNYYKIHGNKENLDNVVIDKVIKYKKENDSEILLKYGELFIKYMEDEKHSGNIFNIYNILYNNADRIESGKRYRRKDPVYLLFEIIEDKYFSNKTVFEFAKTMFFRKSMIERHAFGFWLLCFAWKINKVDFNEELVPVEIIDLDEYFKNRVEHKINDDFVVKDYHVKKSHGLAKFGTIGSLVIDEDLSILGKRGEYFRKLYVDDKNGKVTKKISFKIKSNNDSKNDSSNKSLDPKIKFNIKSKIIDSTNSFNNYDDSKLEVIPFSKFTNIHVLEDGVCGLKVCCLKVDYLGKPHILKEMRASFNYGKDYMLIDELKKYFGIKPINMRRIKCDKYLVRIDNTKKTLVKNWKWEDKEIIYCIMENFDNIGDLGKHKNILENDNVFYECVKIRLYDGLFCSSDNILRNILVNSNNELLSIDEGDIYGKRKEIFNKNDYMLKGKNKTRTKQIVAQIIEDWNLISKISIVEVALKKYGFSNKVDIMKCRFNNYLNIVNKELD